jgi:hypothetical protein
VSANISFIHGYPIGRVLTHKLACKLELVEMDELLQAGQAVDPEREMQEFGMSSKIGGLAL